MLLRNSCADAIDLWPSNHIGFKASWKESGILRSSVSYTLSRDHQGILLRADRHWPLMFCMNGKRRDWASWRFYKVIRSELRTFSSKHLVNSSTKLLFASPPPVRTKQNMGALLPISKWENQVQPMKENREICEEWVWFGWAHLAKAKPCSNGVGRGVSSKPLLRKFGGQKIRKVPFRIVVHFYLIENPKKSDRRRVTAALGRPSVVIMNSNVLYTKIS